MRSSRREFVATRGAASADSPRHPGQGRARSRRCSARASTGTRPSTTGASCRRASGGATRTASSRTRRATSTSTIRCTRPARAPTRWWCSIGTGKFIRSWGKEFTRRCARHVDPQGGERRVPLPDGECRQPAHQPPPELPATVVKATLKGEIVCKIQGPPDVARTNRTPEGTRAPLQSDQHRHRAQRRPLRRRRLRLVLHQSATTPRANTSEHVRRQGIGSRPAARAARHLGRHARRDADLTSPIAATTACSGSRSTASTSISSTASACPATSTSETAWS